jgi:hypothetical protein
MKKFIILLVSLFLFVGIVYSIPTDAQIRQAANTLGVPFDDLKIFVQSYQTQSTPTGTITVTADVLIKAYSDNQLRADNTYKGKTLQITGTVSKIDKDWGDEYFLELTTSSGYSWCTIRAFVKASELNKIANLNKGDSVTIIGKCSEGDSNYVDIKDAYIVR